MRLKFAKTQNDLCNDLFSMTALYDLTPWEYPYLLFGFSPEGAIAIAVPTSVFGGDSYLGGSYTNTFTEAFDVRHQLRDDILGTNHESINW